MEHIVNAIAALDIMMFMRRGCTIHLKRLSWVPAQLSELYSNLEIKDEMDFCTLDALLTEMENEARSFTAAGGETLLGELMPWLAAPLAQLWRLQRSLFKMEQRMVAAVLLAPMRQSSMEQWNSYSRSIVARMGDRLPDSVLKKLTNEELSDWDRATREFRTRVHRIGSLIEKANTRAWDITKPVDIDFFL